jgi:hypothetical protein
MTLYLVLPLAVLALAIVVAIVHAASRHGAPALAYRWLTGQPWHGKAHTNATWLRPADKVLHPSGRASRWAHVRISYRAAVRTLGTGAACAALYGTVTDPRATALAAGGAAIVGLVAAILTGWRMILEAVHHKLWIRPLHLALCEIARVPTATRPKSWIEVPRNFATSEDSKIVIHLPPHYTGTGRERDIPAIVQRKLALEEVTFGLPMHGPDPRLELSVSIPPPSKVSYKMMREAIEAAPDTAPVLGIGRKGAIISASLVEDSPHWLVAAGSGIGKSVITRSMVAQALHHGAVVIVFDTKRTSHAYLRGLPNVLYCKHIRDIHDVLIALEAELERRNCLADELTDIDGELPDPAMLGPRIIILAEEMNTAMDRLKAHWQEIRDKKDPAKSPALKAWNAVLCMGRSCRANVISVGQMGSAVAMGGSAARENMGVRLLGGYTQNAWKMLVPEIQPMPRSVRHAGRFQLCTGGVAREMQALYMKPREARALATSGIVAELPTWQTAGALTGSQVGAQPSDQAQRGLSAHSSALALVGSGDPLGLREAVGKSLSGPDGQPVTLATLRWARANDPAFPVNRGQQGQKHLYLWDDLQRWARNRPIAGNKVTTPAGSGQTAEI